MASFNGWNIVTLPDAWGFRTQEWKIGRRVASTPSPFTGQVLQVFEWVGAESWGVTCNLPPLDADDVRAWRAFFWQAVGGVNAFMLGDPLRRKPKGIALNRQPRSSVRQPLYVFGAHNALQTFINIKGLSSNQPRVLSAGDLISVNYRLYEVLADASANVGGATTVQIMPSLREPLTDGMQILTSDAQGLFRIPRQEIQFDVDENRLTTISFEAVEAR